MFSSRLRRAGRGRFGHRLGLCHLEERVTPTTFVVSNLNDDLQPGSLRKALLNANANPGLDIVDATGVAGTISLISGQLQATGDVEIVGPGASLLAVDAKGLSRCISIAYSGAPNSFKASLSGFTVTGGKITGDGGGISISSNVTVSLSNMIVTKNEAVGQGGGISTRGPSITIIDSDISGNTCIPGGTFGGGALYAGGNATLVNCNISNNLLTAERSGGGISCRSGQLNLVNCELINNRAGTGIGYKASGGAVYLTGATLVAEQCLFANNIATDVGGGIYAFGHSRVRLTNSTLANNQADKGGAIDGDMRELTVKNCTVSGNVANQSGGGLNVSTYLPNTINIENSTITRNTASQGGGINVPDGVAVQLRSTIVADNLGPPTSPDIATTMPINVIDCNIGNVSGIARLDRTGTFVIGSPQLGPLADNGGSTPTHLPGPNSAVRDAGSNALGLLADQRSQPRLAGSRADIGAVEFFDSAPTALVFASDLVARGTTMYQFEVTYEDLDQIDVSSLIGNSQAIQVTGPNGFIQDASFVSIDDPTSGTSRTVTYRLIPPSNVFLPADNGPYNVAIQPNQVFDKTGQSVAGGVRTQFRVFIPSQFVVSNTLDGPVSNPGDLSGSLRQAIFDANAIPTNDSISFDDTVFASSQTITLVAGTLNISDSVHLIGPGQDLLTIDADGKSRGFYLSGVNTFPNTMSISGLSVTNGLVTYGAGGGIYAFSANLIMDDCAIYGNASYDGYSTFVGGGGVYVNSSFASFSNSRFFDNYANRSGGGLKLSALNITIEDCDIDANTSAEGGGGSGGGIYVANATNLLIDDCLISGNTSLANNGGGVYLYRATKITVMETVIAGNSSQSLRGGGGIFLLNQSTSPSTPLVANLKIVKSQIVDNTTTASGGGVFIAPDQLLTIQDSTIDGNTAGRNGGGIYFFNRGGFLIENSTISNNAANGPPANYVLGGGGLYFYGIPASFGLTLRNTTVSTNSSKVNGGGIVAVNAGGLFQIQNCTITNNTAASNGGGIAQISGTTSISLASSIIADNNHLSSPDCFTTGKVTADHSLIGVTNGITTLSATASLTGTLAAPLDPLLAPLADNGGPTKTHVPMPGSPAINRGSHPLNLTYDQRGAGFPRQAGIATDIGAFEFPLPPVAGATINDGTVQRSMIRSFTLAFSEAVTFPNGPGAAIQLERTGPGGPSGLVNLAFQQSGNVVTVTFDDPVFAPGAAKSLVDGKYTLTLVASKIQGAYGPLDGNGDGIAGDNQITMLHRLFGDSNGDGRVDSVDFVAFRNVFGVSNPAFDFNNDGTVGSSDFAEFRKRFGLMI